MQERNTKSVFWQHAVRALAKGELPDFSGDSKEIVGQTFNRLFLSGNVAEELCQEVNDASGGRVRLELADAELFSGRMKVLAVYLRLTVDGQSRLLIFGPYATPFLWDSGR